MVNPKLSTFFLRSTSLLLLTAAGALAQPSAATLSGTVTNAAGDALPSARVTAVNLATQQNSMVEASQAGVYRIPDLAPGEYEVSAVSVGFTAETARVTLQEGDDHKQDFMLMGVPGSTESLSLEDLGFSAEQTRGSTAQQDLLDRRSHMLQMHQRLGLIAAIPMVAALISSGNAAEHHRSTGSSTGRNVHAALGAATAGLYFTSAAYAILAPKVPGTTTKGPIRLHKTLAWIHGAGMILTPILGALAYQQINRGERVHGIAKAHGAVAWTTAIAYGTSIAAVSFKF